MSAEGAPLPPPTGEATAMAPPVTEVPAIDGLNYATIVGQLDKNGKQLFFGVDENGGKHRIGKQEVVDVWNSVLGSTQEGNAPTFSYPPRIESASDAWAAPTVTKAQLPPPPPPAPRTLTEAFGAPTPNAPRAPKPFEAPTGPAKTTEQMREEGFHQWAQSEPRAAQLVNEMGVKGVFGSMSKADALDALKRNHQFESDNAVARGETPRDFEAFVRAQLEEVRLREQADRQRAAAAATPRPTTASPADLGKTPDQLAEEVRVQQVKNDISKILRKDLRLLPENVLNDPVMFEEALQNQYAVEKVALPAGTTFEQWLDIVKTKFEAKVDSEVRSLTAALKTDSINEALNGKEHDVFIAFYEEYHKQCVEAGMVESDIPSFKNWLEDVKTAEDNNRVTEARLTPEHQAKFNQLVDLILDSSNPTIINTYKGMSREEILKVLIEQHGNMVGVSMHTLDATLDREITEASGGPRKAGLPEDRIKDIFGEGHGASGHEKLLTKKRVAAIAGALVTGFAVQHFGFYKSVSWTTDKIPLMPTVRPGVEVSEWGHKLLIANMAATPLYIGARMTLEKIARPFARRKYASEFVHSVDVGDVIVQDSEETEDQRTRIVSIDKANPDGEIEWQILTNDGQVDDRHHNNEENRTIKMKVSDFEAMLRRKQNFKRFANLTKHEAHHSHSEGVHTKHRTEADAFIERIVADREKPEGLLFLSQELTFTSYDVAADTFTFTRADGVLMTYSRDELRSKLIRSIEDGIVTNIAEVQEIPVLSRSQRLRANAKEVTEPIRNLKPVQRARGAADRRVKNARTSRYKSRIETVEQREHRVHEVAHTLDHLRTGKKLRLGIDTGEVEFSKVSRDRSGNIVSATYRTEAGKEVVISGDALKKRVEDMQRVSSRKTRLVRGTGRASKVVARGVWTGAKAGGRAAQSGMRRAQSSYRNRRGGGPTPPRPLPPPVVPLPPPTAPLPPPTPPLAPPTPPSP